MVWGLAGTFVEIGLLWVGLFLIFERRGRTFVEAGACACLTTLMVLTFLVRLVFIAGAPGFALPLEIILLVGSSFLIWRRRAGLAKISTAVTGFLKTNPWVAAFFLAGGIWLLARAVLVAPTKVHWDALAPVLRLEMFATQGWTAAAGHPPILTSHHTLLAYLVLRWSAGFGTGIFALTAYAALGFTTYALARRYAWPPTALTVTLVTLSFPRFVLHATSPGGEIITAAGAVFCILTIYRLVERPHITDLVLLMSAACFTG